MESISFHKRERILAVLQQVENPILLLQKWNADVQEVNGYLLTPEGTKIWLQVAC